MLEGDVRCLTEEREELLRERDQTNAKLVASSKDLTTALAKEHAACERTSIADSLGSRSRFGDLNEAMQSIESSDESAISDSSDDGTSVVQHSNKRLSDVIARRYSRESSREELPCSKRNCDSDLLLQLNK